MNGAQRLIPIAMLTCTWLTVSPAGAFKITHDTMGVLFEDNFESVTINPGLTIEDSSHRVANGGPITGSWLHGSDDPDNLGLAVDGTKMDLMGRAMPRAAEGNQYGYFRRATGNDAMYGQFATSPDSGVVTLDTMIYIPADTVDYRITLSDVTQTDGNFGFHDGGYPHLSFRFDASDARVKKNLSDTTGAQWVAGEWMRFTTSFDILNNTYEMTLINSLGAFNNSGDGNVFGNGVMPSVILSGNVQDGIYLDAVPPPATSFEWGRDGTGEWNVESNWSPGFGGPPNNQEHTAVFAGSISRPTTVVTNGSVTVNRIEFNNGADSYAVAGLGSVNLVADSGGGLPSIAVAQGSHEIQAAVNLAASTTVDIAGGQALSFNNALDLGGNTLTKTGDGTVEFNNNITTSGGTVDCQAGFCGGSGTIVGDVNNGGGTISPGNSPGILTIDGNYTQGASGTLALEIGGLVPGEEHDKLVVNGTATLDGMLDVTLINGFTLSGDMEFDVLDFNSVVNDFSDFNLPTGLVWDVTDGTLCFGTCEGGFTDFDDSGFWDLPDLNLVLFNWQEVEANLPGTWVNQRSATVGLESLNLVLFNWQQPSALAVVPEPSTVMLMWLGMLGTFVVSYGRRNIVCAKAGDRHRRERSSVMRAAIRVHAGEHLMNNAQRLIPIAMLLLTCLTVSPAWAVRVTHDTLGVLFEDNFENVTINPALPIDDSSHRVANGGPITGSWLHGSDDPDNLGLVVDGTQMDLMGRAMPGAAEGSQYGYIRRESPGGVGGDALYGEFWAFPDSGVVTLDTMIYIPEDVVDYRLTLSDVTQTDGNFGFHDGQYPHLSFRFNGNGTVNRDLSKPTGDPTDAQWVPGEWMQFTVSFDILGNSYDMTLVNSLGTFNHSDVGNLFGDGTVRSLILSGNVVDGIYVDAVVAGSPTTSFEWRLNGAGEWDVPGNWTPSVGGPPNNQEHTAVFAGLISRPTTVVTNDAVTVNRIEFNNGADSYAVGGLGSVNLEADSGGGLPSIAVAQGSHQFQADVNLAANTTVDIAGGQTLAFNTTVDLGGNTLTKTGAGTVVFNNTIKKGSGMVNCQEGSCGGTGIISGDLNNGGGTISPGNSPGVWEVAGDFTQAAQGTLLIEIAGTQADVDYDRLVIGGTAELAGSLDVALLNNFEPTAGVSFDILDFAALRGSFDEINLPTLAAGLAWDTSALYSSGSLSVVPEPSIAMLMWLGMLGTIGLIGRRNVIRRDR